jgi:translation initiation factor 1
MSTLQNIIFKGTGTTKFPHTDDAATEAPGKRGSGAGARDEKRDGGGANAMQRTRFTGGAGGDCCFPSAHRIDATAAVLVARCPAARCFAAAAAAAPLPLAPRWLSTSSAYAHRRTTLLKLLVLCLLSVPSLVCCVVPPCVYLSDVFDEPDGEQTLVKDGAKGNYVHIRIQQRNGRKSLTTVAGLAIDLDLKKILKALKKTYSTNGTILTDEDDAEIIQVQGDQRKNVYEFLTKCNIIGKNEVKVHGF